jgi:threonine dehydrogenase-like Zn-dependent dehydrogenase
MEDTDPGQMLGFENLRPWGNISSIGVHNGEIPWTGNQAYGKNLRIQMGRCPVRSEQQDWTHRESPTNDHLGLFEEALEALAKHQGKLEFMFENIVPMSKVRRASFLTKPLFCTDRSAGCRVL